MRKRQTPESSALSQLPPQSRTGKKVQTPQPVTIDQLLTVAQAAAKLGIGRTKLYDLINNNQLP